MDSSILVALGPALVAAVLGILVTRHVVSKPQIARVYDYAKMAVFAAEEYHGPGKDVGEQKLRLAMDTVLARFGLTEDEAQAYVLAAVKQLKLSGLLPNAEAASSNPNMEI